MSTGAVHCFIPFKTQCMRCIKDFCYVKPFQHAKNTSESLKLKEKTQLGYALVVSHCWLKIQIKKNHNKKHLCKCLCRLGVALRLLVGCQGSPQHSEVWVPWLKSKAKHFPLLRQPLHGVGCTLALPMRLSGTWKKGLSRSTEHYISLETPTLILPTGLIQKKKVRIIKTWSYVI